MMKMGGQAQTFVIRLYGREKASTTMMQRLNRFFRRRGLSDKTTTENRHIRLINGAEVRIPPKPSKEAPSNGKKHWLSGAPYSRANPFSSIEPFVEMQLDCTPEYLARAVYEVRKIEYTEDLYLYVGVHALSSSSL